MADVGETGDVQRKSSTRHVWLRRLLPLFGVAGVLLSMVVVYFGYDYLITSGSPCETIFRQTSIKLSSKISFLKTNGEVQIGREPLTELTERAQMTALNLKTCCTVLDTGKLNPEQFLQCKAKARAYEARVDGIVTAVRRLGVPGTGAAAANAGSSSNADDASSLPAPATAAEAKAKIAKEIQAARAISQDFNNAVVAVRKAQAIETLEVLPPRHVEVAAKETEPNNDTLNTNVIETDTWITGAISSGRDSDFYTFTTPDKHRDWITIELENRSTTFEPRIRLFNADKSRVGDQYRTNAGANLSYSFVSAPATRHIFQVSNYYGESLGAYLVRVVATKAYDQFEPNNSVLEATPITADSAVSAKIMDGHDADVFRIETGDGVTQMSVRLTNRSTTLRPRLQFYDANKSAFGDHYNTTGGADLSHAIKVQPMSAYYIRVTDYYTEAPGAYDLQVTLEP